MENLKIIFACTVIYTLFVIIFLEIIMLYTSPYYNIKVRCNSQSVAMYLTIFGALFATNAVLHLSGFDQNMLDMYGRIKYNAPDFISENPNI